MHLRDKLDSWELWPGAGRLSQFFQFPPPPSDKQVPVASWLVSSSSSVGSLAQRPPGTKKAPHLGAPESASDGDANVVPNVATDGDPNGAPDGTANGVSNGDFNGAPGSGFNGGTFSATDCESYWCS